MKSFLVLVLLITSSFGFTQRNSRYNNDIAITGGIQFSQMEFGKFGIQYRNWDVGGCKAKFAFVYDKFQGENRMNREIIYDTLSLRIDRSQSVYIQRYQFRYGHDYEIARFITAGFDFILGINKHESIINDRGQRYSLNDDSWYECYQCVSDYHGTSSKELPLDFTSSSNVYSTYLSLQKYLSFGVALNFGFQIPLSNRLEIGVLYSPEYTVNTVLKNEVYYEGEGNYKNAKLFYGQYKHYLDFNLKFRF